MILDKLVEKKDLMIYIDQRILRLWLDSKVISDRLHDPSVSRKEKKGLMRGGQKLRGRCNELRYLKMILSEGRLRALSKEMWKMNYQDGLIE